MMINYFNEEKFDFKKFLNKEASIMLHWEDKEVLSNLTESELITKYTIYLGHILDEILEAKEALYETLNTIGHEVYKEKLKEFYKEIIDIAMYIGSVANIFAVKYEAISNTFILDDITYALDKFKLRGKAFYKQIRTRRINELMETVINTLTKLRLFFPHRKWHKEHIAFTNKQYMKACKSSYLLCIDAIRNIMLYLCSIESNDYISELINEKQFKIENDYKIQVNNTSHSKINIHDLTHNYLVVKD